MGQDWALYVAVWVASATGCYVIAKVKGDPDLGRWAAMGVLFGPLGVVLALVLAKPGKATTQPAAAPAAQVVAGTLSSAAFCPACGAKRLGSYRYCTTCKFDYDTGTAGIPAAAPGVPAASVAAGVPASAGESRSYTAVTVLVVAIVVVLLIGSQLLSKGGPNLQSVTGGANLPPVGAVWFGRSFDTTTLEITGKVTSITARETVALVAQLPAAVEASALNVRVSVDGQVVSNSGFNASGESNLWGWTAGPLYLPGAWKFELTDVGGNVLASGSLTVTE